MPRQAGTVISVVNFALYLLRPAVVVITVACISVGFPAVAQDKRENRIDADGTAINGLQITMKERDIVSFLGQPHNIEHGFSEVKAMPSKILRYDGLKIYLIGDEIHSLSCTGKSCRTDRGISVGDAKGRVLEIYGPGNPPHVDASGDSLSYPFKAKDAALVFEFRNGEVAEIRFFVDYV